MKDKQHNLPIGEELETNTDVFMTTFSNKNKRYNN